MLLFEDHSVVLESSFAQNDKIFNIIKSENILKQKEIEELRSQNMELVILKYLSKGLIGINDEKGN